MQTTLRLDDDLYREVKARSARLGISLTRFLEDALREHLAASNRGEERGRVALPVSSASGGLREGFESLRQAIDAADLELDFRQVR